MKQNYFSTMKRNCLKPRNFGSTKIEEDAEYYSIL